ncbi:MAG: DUF262 domain-containing protein [Paludibacteraceae bacterium]|jgi:uncharacterized protein with ParB-like and HNH nuclease domain|nr:DUF262 domain-containing protein [Paludibacteraceae bacterium]
MDFKSLRIVDAIKELNVNYFLPAIQREFVWHIWQIEKLFDSIMRDYPIGSFLFWKVKEENLHEWASYNFINNFNTENPQNEEANLKGLRKDIYLILDGQQRLTAFNIGLKGSYRFFYYRWYKTKLFLNLLKEPIVNEDEPEELIYQFKFKENNTTQNGNEFWYEVGKILDYKDSEDAKNSIESEISHLTPEQQKNAKSLIGKLHNRIHTFTVIYFYEETAQDYDKVLEIFIRVNNGGTRLSYSDLLLSTATSKWKNLDARQEINDLLSTINNIGSRYNFEKDFILKSCLYLSLLPIQYKVKNFTQKNLYTIEDNWDKIKKSILLTIELIHQFGLSSYNILSQNALIPIAFYLMKINNPDVLVKSEDKVFLQEKLIIKKWLIISYLKNAFGSSSDRILMKTRDILQNNNSNSFPYRQLFEASEVFPSLSDEEFERFFSGKIEGRYTYLLLSMLYSGKKLGDYDFHVDHIFPAAAFDKKSLKRRNYSEEKINKYISIYNSLPNFELLKAHDNIVKSDKPFEEWLATRDDSFKDEHFIPKNVDLNMDNFLEFYEERKKLIKENLKLQLNDLKS